MLKNQKLIDLLADILPMLKEFDAAQESKKEEEQRKIIPFNAVYEMAVRQKRRIEIHAEDGVFPYDLFRKRAPNQTQEEFDYLQANYKSITLPVWQAFQSLLNRIWVDQNWKINYKGNEDLQKYLDEDYPLYGSLEDYFKDVVTNQKEIDNNGVLVVKPYHIPTREVEGEVMIDDRGYIDPYVHYYSSESLLDFDKGEYAICLSAEKTTIEYKGAKRNTGYVIEVYDDTYIYRFEQYGKKTDWTFDLVLWFKHDLGYMPVWKLNGKAKQCDDEVFYQSVFIPSVANLDRALLDDSYLNAKKAQVAYPHKWEYVSECTFKDDNGANCIHGNISFDGAMYKCPSCKGSGKTSAVMGVTQVQMPDLYNPSANSIAPPFVGFVEPGTDNLKFLREEIDKAIAKGASMLRLDITESVTKTSNTATGDAISREETFTMIKGISDQIFALYNNCIKAIAQIRFGIDTELPSLTPPRTFEFRSDTDITEELVKMKAAGMPDVVMVQAIKEFMNIRFALDIESQNILNLATYADRLLTLSPDDVLKKKAANTIMPWEDILHTSMYAIIAQALSEEPKLFDKEVKDQKDAIVKIAQRIALSITAASPASTSSILDNANA